MRAGALYATNIGALHPLGIEGWRFAFLSVGLLSATIGKHTLMPLPHQLIMDPLYCPSATPGLLRDFETALQSAQTTSPQAGGSHWRVVVASLGVIGCVREVCALVQES